VSTKQNVAVLGLGRFGQAVAKELTRLGHDVLAIDSSEKIVEEVADEVTHAVQADVTDPDALQELGLADFDTVVVATSSQLEASILATVLVQRLGVKRVLAKAANQLHGSILEQVGASRVVYPEHETGIRVAHSFAAPGVRDYLDVAPGYGFARVSVVEDWLGKALGTLDLPGTCGVRVMALTRAGTVVLDPPPLEALRAGDQLIVAGRDEDLERLPGTPTPPR
jgi:trk system potassium uptake protein TrkA